MLISLLVILTDIEIPDFVTNIIYFIAQSGALVCLFVIGGTLFGVTLSNYGFKMYGIVLGKLIFLPFVVFIAFKIFPFIMGIGLVNDDLRKAAIIMASTPAMTLYPILAARNIYSFWGGRPSLSLYVSNDNFIFLHYERYSVNVRGLTWTNISIYLTSAALIWMTY